MPIRCQGVRGATTVASNTAEEILEATSELLAELMQSNDLNIEDVASAFFTTTRDLNAEFPAVAANRMGWTDIALMCGHEMEVPGSLPMCLRVLLHVNTEKAAGEIRHVYLRGARALRPDRVEQEDQQTEAISP
jgi:chorismate mutase